MRRFSGFIQVLTYAKSNFRDTKNGDLSCGTCYKKIIKTGKAAQEMTSAVNTLLLQSLLQLAVLAFHQPNFHPIIHLCTVILTPCFLPDVTHLHFHSPICLTLKRNAFILPSALACIGDSTAWKGFLCLKALFF